MARKKSRTTENQLRKRLENFTLGLLGLIPEHGCPKRGRRVFCAKRAPLDPLLVRAAFLGSSLIGGRFHGGRAGLSSVFARGKHAHTGLHAVEQTVGSNRTLLYETILKGLYGRRRQLPAGEHPKQFEARQGVYFALNPI